MPNTGYSGEDICDTFGKAVETTIKIVVGSKGGVALEVATEDVAEKIGVAAHDVCDVVKEAVSFGSEEHATPEGEVLPIKK